MLRFLGQPSPLRRGSGSLTASWQIHSLPLALAAGPNLAKVATPVERPASQDTVPIASHQRGVSSELHPMAGVRISRLQPVSSVRLTRTASLPELILVSNFILRPRLKLAAAQEMVGQAGHWQGLVILVDSGAKLLPDGCATCIGLARLPVLVGLVGP